MKQQPRCSATAQRGAVLMMVVVMLVVVGLTAVAIMRTALASEQIAGNVLTRLAAAQAAETALHRCEAELLRPDPALDIQPAPATGMDAAWQDLARWSAALRIAAPAGESPAPPSLCLVERAPIASEAGVYIVTARGYSPGYLANATSDAQPGAAVWLQSVLAFTWRPRSGTGDDAVTAGDSAFGIGTQRVGAPSSAPSPDDSIVMLDDPDRPLPAQSTCPADCERVLVDRVWTPIVNPPLP